jgi:hypothetical protein
MGRWKDMKGPELLEDYAARLMQAEEDQPMGLSAGGGPLRVAQPFAASQAPFTQLPQKPEAGESGSGYYTYGTVPKWERGTTADHQWGTPGAMQVITSVAGQLANGKTPTPFGVGNISLSDGRPTDHAGHRLGDEIDVRPARADGKERQVDYQSPDYDREATQRLIRAFQATGQVDRILFNDPNIGIEGVRSTPGHDNHFHVRLKR